MPRFALTRETGAPHGSAELDGHPWIANFIFTRCTAICPAFTLKMAGVQSSLEREKLDAKLVSFSVDPTYDTPERLADYAKRHGADPARWAFVTGDPKMIKAAVVDGLKVAAEPPLAPGQDPDSIFHGSHFVLVDAQGRIRGYYDSNDDDATQRLISDLRRL